MSADYDAIATAIEAAVKAEIEAAIAPIGTELAAHMTLLGAHEVRLDALEAEPPTPIPGPEPEPEPTPTGVVFGPGMAGDGKWNQKVMGGLGCAMSFIASRSEPAVAVIFQMRQGSGYSAGSGFTFQVGLQPDADGKPSATWLASESWKPPVASGGNGVRIDLTPSPMLDAGTKYWIVWRNAHASPGSNFVSVNFLSNAAGVVPRYPDDECIVMDGTSGTWKAVRNKAPSGDVIYASGAHELNLPAYIRRAGDAGALVDGTKKIRERWTQQAPVTITQAFVRMGWVSGSGPLTLSLLRGTTVLGSVTVPGGSSLGGKWPLVTSDPTGTFVGGTLSGGPHALAAGTEYSLEVTCEAGSTYFHSGIGARDSGAVQMDSHHFAEGRGEYTAGGSWQPWENSSWGPWNDLQCYMT